MEGRSMSEAREHFVDLCLKGQESPAAIDDYIDLWHEREDDGSLAEFLGFTPEELASYVEDPANLQHILSSRKRGIPPHRSAD
jgi:hypothetical protein